MLRPVNSNHDAAPGGGGRAAGLGVAAVLAAFFAPALLSSAQFVYRDTGRMHAPVKRWIGEELARGRFPEWNPYSGLGVPVVGNAIDGVQHPLTLLLAVLPPDLQLKVWILASFAAAAGGAAVLARALGASPIAAAVGALAFALSGPLVSSSDNVTYLTAYAALPWLLAAGLRHARRGGPGPLALVAVASYLCAAAGDPQGWALGAGALLLSPWLARPPGGARPPPWRGAVALGVAALAAAPVLLPLAAWLPESGRAEGMLATDLARWNLHPRRLVELAVPDVFRTDPADPRSPVFETYAGNDVTQYPWFLSVYLGATSLALAGVAAARDLRVRLLAGLALLLAWAALGPHAGFGQLAARLPILGAFRFWEKLAIGPALFLAPAAALGADALARGAAGRLAARIAGAAAVLLLALGGIAAASPRLVHAIAGGPFPVAAQLADNLAAGAARAGVVAGLLALLAVLRERGALARGGAAAVAVVVAVDLFGGNAGAYVLGPAQPTARPALAAGLPDGARVVQAFSEPENRWPELGRLGSAWEWNRRTLAASWNVPLRLGSNHDYVGLRQRRWVRYRLAVDEGRDVSRMGLLGFGHLVVPGQPENAARAGVPLPPRIGASDPDLPAWRVELAHRPRAHLAARVRSADAEASLAFAVAGGEAGVTVVEGPVPSDHDPAAAAAGAVRIVSDEGDALELEASVEGRALLVLSDAHAPGWTASVDGAPAEIVRANGLVRAVWLAPGAHRVTFRYRSPGLVAGWALAAGLAAALGGWALARRRLAGAARGTAAG
jgi:hypothetical protein